MTAVPGSRRKLKVFQEISRAISENIQVTACTRSWSIDPSIFDLKRTIGPQENFTEQNAYFQRQNVI
jgi:hypothetical protein